MCRDRDSLMLVEVKLMALGAMASKRQKRWQETSAQTGRLATNSGCLSKIPFANSDVYAKYKH